MDDQPFSKPVLAAREHVPCREMPTGPPPVIVQVSVAPRITVTNQQEGGIMLLVGIILAFAGVLLVEQRKRPDL